MDDLYRQAVTMTSKNNDEIEKSKTRMKLHIDYVDSVFDKIVRDVTSVDITDIVKRAAQDGKNRVVIWKHNSSSVYGWNSVIQENGVIYESKPLPIPFLVKGPKKEEKKRVFGLKYFTFHGIEPLQQRLMLKFSPFKVYVNLNSNYEFDITLSWTEQHQQTSIVTEPEDSDDDVEISI